MASSFIRFEEKLFKMQLINKVLKFSSLEEKKKTSKYAHGKIKAG